MKREEESNEKQIENDYDIKKDKIKVLHHADGNIKYVSVHQTLSQVYDKIFNLNILYTKSYDTASNILLENLPIITYGVNQVKYPNFNIFFKKLINLQDKFESESEIKLEIEKLEKIIFTDLQLFLSIYINYLKRNSNLKEYLRKCLNFVYRPINNIKAFFNDRRVLHEMKRVFNFEDMKEVKINFNYFFSLPLIFTLLIKILKISYSL